VTNGGKVSWRYLAVATQAVLQAGAIQRSRYGQKIEVRHKGEIDLVTEVDRACEDAILVTLRARFPDHDIVTEETAIARTGSRFVWFIDPLDGTTNFTHNYPFFCVSIAAESGGRLAAGAVYDPVRDELFAAAAGHGATLNGRAIRVSDIARVEDALLVTGFPYDVREHPERSLPLFEAFLVRAQAIRRDGSAALNLCYLACGRFDGFWETHLAPWDMAAGTLLVREAGGLVTGYEGGEFRLDGRQILASNGRIHEEMRTVIGGAGGTAGS
jgi:myo-inositol-1(or 4)-monophosphatase